MSGESSFREEDCPAHKHVEWDVSYVALRESGEPLMSPVFKVEEQSYILVSRWNKTQPWSEEGELSLWWKGPLDIERFSAGRCWAGLKCSDGTYRHRNMTRTLYLSKERTSWKETDLSFRVRRSDVERGHLTDEGRMTFFFRMNVGRSPAGVEVCTHVTVPAPEPPSGNVRKEVCSTHSHVEWNVDYEKNWKDDLCRTSPSFVIGPQTFFFESRFEPDGRANLRVYRIGRRGFGNDARFWLGLMVTSWSYHEETVSDVLDMREDLGLWTEVATTCYRGDALERRNLGVGRNLKFFFRLNVDTAGAEMCTHGIPPVPFHVHGRVRKDRCSNHTQVEWDVVPAKGLDTASPAFEIGRQHFFFKPDNKRFFPVAVFRLGPPLYRYVQCWAGLRHVDGSYPVRVCSKTLFDREEHGLWTRLPICLDLFDLDNLNGTSGGLSTIFFRMRKEFDEVESDADESCSHLVRWMPAPTSGSIREERCFTHTHVEWDVDYNVPGKEGVLKASPIFQIGTQLYFLDLHLRHESGLSLHLFRLGRSVARSFRWWAGLRIRDGTRPLRNESSELDLREDLELWTKVDSVFSLYDSGLVDQCLTPNGRLKFFFRLNVEPKGEEWTCTHGAADMHAGEGSIRQEVCPSHRHVTWVVTYRSSPGSEHHSTSPSFEIENQRYHLHLRCKRKGVVKLRLYRLGRSVEVSVGCWAGLKNDDGTYHHRIRFEELDLSHECSLWTKEASFRLSNRPDLERSHVTSDGCLSVFLQVGVVRPVADKEACAHGADLMCPTHHGIIRQIKSHLVDWDVPFEDIREHAHLSTSPAFWIENHCYLLELLYEGDGVLALSVYFSRHTVEGSDCSIRCWAGLRGVGVTHYHFTKGVKLYQKESSELWMKAAVLGYFRRSDLEKWKVVSDGRMTIVFQVDSSDYEDRLRRDYRLWLQHPEEAENIRRRRRVEAEDRIRIRRARSFGGKPSFCAA